jgi:toxin ParE1/3/4
MNLNWSPTARAHLRHAEAFIAEDNPRAAARMAARIIDAVERLRELPASGRPGSLPHTRELVVPGTPFFLTYRVRDGAVEILGLMHGARKWPVDGDTTGRV